MRNLKKVLSLTLALVMLIGMMVVGAGAAEIKDVDSVKVNNQEAVKVMNKLNILVGDENGNFNPNGNLNRAAAAKIILAVAKGMPVLEAALKIGNSVMFDDITGDEQWAGGIADYCANLEIVKGTDPGKFSPADNVTIIQFATMLARVMDPANVEKYTGADWEVNTKVFATQCGLTEALSIADWNADMTREQAAQMAFNGLTTDPSGEIEYVVTYKENGEDETIPCGNDYDLAKLMAALNKGKITTKKSEENTLGKQNYGLTSGDKVDDLGRKVKTWEANSVEIYAGTESIDAPTKVIAGEKFKIADLTKDGYTVDATQSTTAETKFYYNGVQVNTSAGNAFDMDNAPGATIEVYATGKKVTKIVAIEPYFTVVNDVDKDGNVKLDVKEFTTQATITIKTTDADYTLVKDMVKGDVFMGVYNAKNWAGTTDRSPLVEVYAVDQIEGVVTARTIGDGNLNGEVNVTVGGNKYTLAKEWGYKVSAAAKVPALAEEGTLYVYDGYAYWFKKNVDEPTGPSTDYALVVKTAVTTVSGEAFAEASKKVTARVVLSDGTVADYPLASVKGTGEDDGKTFIAGTTTEWPAASETEMTAIHGKVFSYEVKDGVMTLGALKANSDLAADQKPVIATQVTNYNGESLKGTKADSKQVLFNDKTVFVLYDVSGNTVKPVGKIVGPAGLGDQSSNTGLDWDVVATGVDATYATANVVFAKTTVGTITTDNLVYVFAGTQREELAADGKTKNYAYDAYTLTGEKIDVHTKQGGTVTVSADGVFSYTADGTLGTAGAPSNLKAEAVITIIGDQILRAGDTSGAYNKTADTIEVIVADGAKLESGCKAVLVLDGTTNNIATIFVTEGK